MTNPWSSGTNWTVSRGSLNSVVTFESFDFPIDSDSTARKPPLLLLPPSSSSDYEPCEIKLSFTQKHEIRQVYVRSTARVYEIYYAPTLQSDNEYLCTVRCSAASVDDNLFPATDEILPKARVANENKNGTNEDDWVEVKHPVGQVDEGKAYLPNQDYYEATAEINDSEPCMSLTLRLLSLQSKGCVYVDEVYIFADPVDSENQTVNAENSTSSLMTMLVPTLLGLTKSKSVHLHNQNNLNPVAKPSPTESQPTTLTNLVDRQDEKSLKQSDSKTELTRLQLPDKDKVCDSTMRNDFSTNRAEILLEQLVSRVTRIEDICLRFEENMLKPIHNLEVRLERVEQQVELLAKKSQCPVSPPSCPTFEPNPINDSQLCGESESEKIGSFSNGTHKPLEVVEDTSTLESPCCDEKEEENEVLESPKKEKPKKTVSIDDALAAAFAGFSSFTKSNDSLIAVPLEPPEEECLISNQASVNTNLGSNSDSDASVSCESLKATAPEFTGEENVEATTSCDVYSKIPDDIFHLQGTSEVTDEEATSPTASFSNEYYETDEGQLVKQDSINEVKISTFDKTDIFKYFPDESESRVDFESPILEVKFASLENGSRGSHLESLLSYTDDTSTNEGILITPQSNEETATANNLLMDLDGDDVGEGVQQHVQQETSFASLI